MRERWGARSSLLVILKNLQLRYLSIALIGWFSYHLFRSMILVRRRRNASAKALLTAPLINGALWKKVITNRLTTQKRRRISDSKLIRMGILSLSIVGGVRRMFNSLDK